MMWQNLYILPPNKEGSVRYDPLANPQKLVLETSQVTQRAIPIYYITSDLEKVMPTYDTSQSTILTNLDI